MNRVVSTQVFDASSARLAETRYFYDQETSHTTPPTKGELRRVEATANGTHFFPHTRHAYDAYGNLTSTTDARGNTTTIEYDPAYQIFPICLTNAATHQTHNTYDYRLGKLSSTTDPNGATTRYTYDVLGRTTSIKLPLEQLSANATVLYEFTTVHF